MIDSTPRSALGGQVLSALTVLDRVELADDRFGWSMNLLIERPQEGGRGDLCSTGRCESASASFLVTEHSIHEPRSGMTRKPCNGRSPSCASTRKSTPGERCKLVDDDALGRR